MLAERRVLLAAIRGRLRAVWLLVRRWSSDRLRHADNDNDNDSNDDNGAAIPDDGINRHHYYGSVDHSFLRDHFDTDVDRGGYDDHCNLDGACDDHDRQFGEWTTSRTIAAWDSSPRTDGPARCA